MTNDQQRFGILGGSFDPIHYGHLLLAESCREQCKLDLVWLLPAASAPHKLARQTAAARHRIAMLNLAIGGSPFLQVNSMEVDRGGVSYTTETLAELHQQHPQAQLFFLMGADSLVDLPHWREPRRICELAIPVVVRRVGSDEPDYDALKDLVDPDRLALFRHYQVTMPLIELTSTDIRNRVKRGESIRYRTPRAVEKYIETNKLYVQQSGK
jgi:nicotinate-nucleotide adenylyltransferase